MCPAFFSQKKKKKKKKANCSHTAQHVLQNGVLKVSIPSPLLPGMNAIENDWALLNWWVNARGAQYVHQLRATIEAGWRSLAPPVEVEPFCPSKTDRTHDLIKAQGSHMKY